MKFPEPRIYDIGDSAMTIEFGDGVDADLNRLSIACADALNSEPFHGMIEAVPAYAAATVFYDPAKIAKIHGMNADIREVVRARLIEAAARAQPKPASEESVVTIPARFGGDSGPDLAAICDRSGLDERQVIDLFISREYRVFMLGFLPGFAYMGKVDPVISIPRRDEPRLRVPSGSIGIADEQTGIYPFDSPGGWQLIGRCDVEIFNKDKMPPWAFAPGDRVRFIQI
jgi:inhibitor of KinA